MTHEAIDGRDGGHGVFEDLLPLGEGQVGGERDAAAFVAFGQEREERLAPCAPGRDPEHAAHRRPCGTGWWETGRPGRGNAQMRRVLAPASPGESFSSERNASRLPASPVEARCARPQRHLYALTTRQTSTSQATRNATIIQPACLSSGERTTIVSQTAAWRRRLCGEPPERRADGRLPAQTGGRCGEKKRIAWCRNGCCVPRFRASSLLRPAIPDRFRYCVPPFCPGRPSGLCTRRASGRRPEKRHG